MIENRIEYKSHYNSGTEDIYLDGYAVGSIIQNDVVGMFNAVIKIDEVFLELGSQDRDVLKSKIEERLGEVA